MAIARLRADHIRTYLTPTIIDVEASGFGAHSYPIEVGVVKANGERFCCLIKPIAPWQHWDLKAQQLHHISREMLLRIGQDVQVVCTQLNAFMANETAYSDGWVVDQPWLIKLFAAAQIPMKFRLSPLETILNEEQMALWQPTKEGLLARQAQARHRASFDAALIQQTYTQTQYLVAAQRATVQTLL
jgi:hypothetical protein